jgi:hypothetical protein
MVMGLALVRRWTQLGLVVATVSALLLLYLASTPVVANYLFGCVVAVADTMPSLPSHALPGAIVVLASDYRRGERYTGAADP